MRFPPNGAFEFVHVSICKTKAVQSLFKNNTQILALWTQNGYQNLIAHLTAEFQGSLVSLC